jgi:transposase-like protein
MIRLFTALCKHILENLPDGRLFLEAVAGFRHHGAKCPRCGATGKLSPHGAYFRNLVSFEDNQPLDQRVSPPRFKCASCGATHALLPDVSTPYSQYSLRFKLAVLIAYFERATTVVAICERFGIAVSTLYRWKGLLLGHKELLLGALASLKEPALGFLLGLLGDARLSERLQGFFRRHGFSFMQRQPIAATRTRPP